MTEPLDRNDIISLLNGLGSDRDEDVLEAARQVHARITAAGMAWEDLLVPDQADEDAGEAEDADEDAGEAKEADEDAGETEDADGAEDPDPKGRHAESLAQIDKLLARSGISDDLREELKGYKTDIAEGEFQDADRRYLRALSARLTKRRRAKK